MRSYNETDKSFRAKQAFAVYGSYATRACWLVLLGGIALSAMIANGYGMEWGQGIMAGYRVCVATTVLALVCASGAIYFRANGQACLSFVICVLLLSFLIKLAMDARPMSAVTPNHSPKPTPSAVH